jgi:hypothetical protein
MLMWTSKHGGGCEYREKIAAKDTSDKLVYDWMASISTSIIQSDTVQLKHASRMFRVIAAAMLTFRTSNTWARAHLAICSGREWICTHSAQWLRPCQLRNPLRSTPTQLSKISCSCSIANSRPNTTRVRPSRSQGILCNYCELYTFARN